MYTVRNMLGEVVGTGDTPQSAYIAAEKASGLADRRTFPRYVEQDYVRRPYEQIFTVEAEGMETLVVAVYELEHQFIYTLSGILALIDADMTTIPEAQASLDALKEHTLKWSSFGREKIRTLILDNFKSDKAEVVLVHDRVVIRPK